MNATQGRMDGVGRVTKPHQLFHVSSTIVSLGVQNVVRTEAVGILAVSRHNPIPHVTIDVDFLDGM